MREVFRLEPGEPADPGRVFYTITADDIGSRHIDTTIGTIHLRESIGEVNESDIGRRMFRVPMSVLTPGAKGWTWIAEAGHRRAARLADERNLRGVQIGDNNTQPSTFS